MSFSSQHKERGKQEKDESAVAALAAGGGDAVKEAALLESWKAYKRGFQQGVALFNVKPKKGVAFLQARTLAVRLDLCLAESALIPDLPNKN